MMITDAQSDFARQKLIKAFYLPNGVLKEVARHLPETAKVAMPAVITKAEHAQGRTMLNHFLCQQKVGGELGVQAAKGIDLLQKRLDERDDLGHWNHIEPLQNIYASSLKGEVYQEPVVVPAQKVEAEASAKQEETTTESSDAAQEIYKAVAVKGALAATVPVALNQAKQKRMQKPLSDAQSSIPMPPSPEDPEKEKLWLKVKSELHPNGIYEDAGYHGKYDNNLKSRAPKNGQAALDKSIQVKDTGPRRIAVIDDEFVILDRTSEGLYHGHVRSWDQLTQKMKNVLRENGFVTSKGKIIK